MKQALILFALFFASTFAYRCGPTDILFLKNTGFSVNTIASGLLANQDRMVAAYSAPADPETNPFFTQSADQFSDFFGGLPNEDVTTLLQGVPAFFAANARAGSQRVVVLVTGSSTVNNYENAAMLARNLRASGIEIYVYGVSANSQTAQLATSPAEKYVENDQTSMTLLISKVEGRSCLAFGSNPRIGTFDGSSYLFNGVGDYVFYQSSSTYAQIRVEACDMMIPQSRTCITAVAVDDDAFIYYDPKQDIVSSVSNFNFEERSDISAGASILEYRYGDYYVYVISGAGLQVEYRADDNIPNGVTGLCGLYDGCNTNDFVSRDGVMVAPGAAPADIYRSFADTWRVQGTSDFDRPIDNEYYWTNYPQYLKDFAPVYSEAPTEQTQSACSSLSGINSFLYQSCQDAVVAGLTSFQESAFAFAMRQCSAYCGNPSPTINPFVTAAFCEPLCFDGSFFTITDKFEDVTDIGPVDNFDTEGVFSQYSTFLGGTYVFDYKNDNCPSQSKPITLQINCENSAKISAGASRTVTKPKNEEDFPIIYVFGSMVDRTTELEYAYKLVDFPKAIEDNNNADRYVMTEGYTNVGTEQNPIWSPALPSIEFYNVRTPIASFQPEFPGDYVLELSVYDGCSIARSNVTISVACDNCALAGQSSPAASLSFEYNGGFDYTSSSSTGGIYQSTGTSASSRWLLETVNVANSTFEFRGEDSGSNRNYYLYVPIEDVIVNVTETVEVTVLQNNTNSPVINTNPTIGTVNNNLRVEANDRISTVTVEVETVTKDTIYYSSIEGEDTKCTITFGNTFDDSTVTVNAQEADFSTSDLYNNVLNCLGDYNLVFAMRDTCQDATYSQPLSIRCSDPPVARLTTCLKDLPYNYAANEFLEVALDARDSVDADSTLTYRYDLYAPGSTTPSPMPMSGCSGANTNVGSSTYTNCAQATFTPNMVGEWRIDAIVFDGCSSSSATTSVNVICQTITPVISGAANFNDASSQTITLNATLTTFGEDNSLVSTLWTITRSEDPIIPAEIVDQMVGAGRYPVVAPNNNLEEFSPVFYLEGTYAVDLTISDGCHTEQATASIVYSCVGTVTINFDDVVAEVGSNLVLNGTQFISYPDNGNTNYVQYVIPGVGTFTNPADLTAITANFGNGFSGAVIPITITAGNGCKWAQKNITLTVSCPNPLPKPAAVSGAAASYSLDIFNPESITVNPALEVFTLLQRPDGSEIASAFNDTEFTFSSTDFNSLGEYTLISYVVNCGERLYSDPVTFQVNCFYSSGANIALAPGSFAFANGKFPKASLSVTFTGEFINNTYKEWPSTDGVWRVTFAEMGSVFRPYDNDVTIDNTTTTSETVKVGPVGGFWTSTNTTTETITTVTKSREVFLKSITNEALAEKFDTCFYPDVGGTYTVEFSFMDYCGVRQTSAPQNIVTTCNAAPTLTAEDATLSLAGRELGDVLVTLKSNTSDADGDFVYTSWSFVQFTGNYIVNSVTITNQENPVASFRPQYVGEYLFEVTATDGCSSVSQNITVTVGCATPYDATRPTITFNYDGYNFVPLHKFTLDVTPRCDGPNFDPELVSYTPPQVSPFPAPAPGTTTGAASTVSFSLALIALIALSLIM